MIFPGGLSTKPRRNVALAVLLWSVNYDVFRARFADIESCDIVESKNTKNK